MEDFAEKMWRRAAKFNPLQHNQNQQSMKDKLSNAQAKAAEKNQKREQQEKDKVTPQR